MSKASEIEIVVSGGSIGGLTVALLLQDRGFNVHVYERNQSRLDGRGAGIVLHEATLRYPIQRAHFPIDKISVGAPYWRYLSQTDEIVFEEPSNLRFTSWNTLYESLLGSLEPSRYHMGAAVTSFTQDEKGVVVALSNGDAIPCDLLVCAEGISSTTRQLLMKDVQPQYSGYIGWRGTITPEELSSAAADAIRDSISWSSPPNNQILVYPIPSLFESQSDLHNWIWYRNINEGSDLEWLLTDRTGVLRQLSVAAGSVRQQAIDEMKLESESILSPSFAEIVNKTKEPFIQVIVDLEVPQMALGRVCLIGDAAFVARPHAAAGTAKAADDAWTLATCLPEDSSKIPEALAEWQQNQLQIGRNLVQRSRSMGERSQFTNTWWPEDQDLRFGLRGPEDYTEIDES